MRRFISTDHYLLGARLALVLASLACTGTLTPGGGAGDAPGGPHAAGVLPLRRLTNREYNNTVRDLLGDTSQPANQFPSDRDKTFAFRRAGDLAVQDATLLRTAAEQLAANAKSKLNANGLLPCDPAGNEEACAQQFLASFGQRAFRRPLTADESARLTGLYTSARSTLGLGFADALSLLIEAVLQAPQFLYHWEAPPSDPPVSEDGATRLSSFQMASRLSYFLWGSMPDEALLAAAAAGSLDSADGVDGVEAQARRLLADDKAKATVSSFFFDWLELDGLAERTKSTAAYPSYTPAVQAAMLAETRSFVENVTFAGDGRLATLLGAPYSFIDMTLAPFYGASGAAATPAMVSLPATERAGLLTQGAFLALTGNADGSNPVRRGKAIYTKLLCHTLPSPPPVVPPPNPASAGGTTRQRFVVHDQNACTGTCHAAMDPIGFAFESYDGVGKFRTEDNGQSVDATGSLTLDGVAHDFANAVDLAGLLAASPEVRTCFATQWVRFALARNEAPADEASVQAVAAAFASDSASVQDLLIAVSTMRSFRYRSLSPGETP